MLLTLTLDWTLMLKSLHPQLHFSIFFYKAIQLDTLHVSIGNTSIKVHHFFIDSFSLKAA
jgi:hypothetical protein